MPHRRVIDLSFRSLDGRFGLLLPACVLARILRACHRAGEAETGGILVGYYTAELDRAVVTAASLAPRDSRAGPTWFERGVRGLQGWLRHTWRARGHFYTWRVALSPARAGHTEPDRRATDGGVRVVPRTPVPGAVVSDRRG